MTPPFTIEDNTDGGDDIRMKYRYLDLRRNAVRSNLELRHKIDVYKRQAYVKCDDKEDEHYQALLAMEEQLKTFRTLAGEPYRCV